MYRRLTKSNDKMIAGICGGIADYFEIDSTLVRVGYAAITCFSGIFPGIIVYLILHVIIPNSDFE